MDVVRTTVMDKWTMVEVFLKICLDGIQTVGFTPQKYEICLFLLYGNIVSLVSLYF